MKYILLLLLAFVAIPAHAGVSSYTRTPATNAGDVIQQTNIDITLTANTFTVGSCFSSSPTPSLKFNAWAITLTDIYGSTKYRSQTFSTTTLNASFNWQFDQTYDARQILFSCRRVNGSWTEAVSLEFLGGDEPFQIIFTTQQYVEPVVVASIWAGSNGFWGSTTPSEISTAMVASVQATGLNIYPLISLVGIPIAFILVGLMIFLINKQVNTGKNKRVEIINPSGNDLIYHSAEDLEFKREYGQEKRKRGRPRKIPL